MSANLAEKEN